MKLSVASASAASSSDGDGDEQWKQILLDYIISVYPNFRIDNPNLFNDKGKIKSFPDLFIYLNGRFNGLFSLGTVIEGFGGHPGLFLFAMIMAVLLNNNALGINISQTVDSVKNPLLPEFKVECIQKLLPVIKDNFLTYLSSTYEQEQEQEQEQEAVLLIERKFNKLISSGIVLSTEGLFKALPDLTRRLSSSNPDKRYNGIIVLSGLEEHPTTHIWYNKYPEGMFVSLIRPLKKTPNIPEK